MDHPGLPPQALLDGLGHGVLLFDHHDHLAMDNATARELLGADYRLVEREGWSAAIALLSPRSNDPDQTLDAIRERARASQAPVRFYAFRGGASLPCWASALPNGSEGMYTMLTLDVQDWTALVDIVDHYLGIVRDHVGSTRGHANLIMQVSRNPKPNESIEQVGKRIAGFARTIQVHMHRLGALTSMMERLEKIRTGSITEEATHDRRQISLNDFFEDFLESLDEEALLDPETDSNAVRRRVQLHIPGDLHVYVSVPHLTVVLRDILRNAIMYSLKAAPVRIRAHASGRSVQVDIADEGCGIRESEAERVFTPFQRARQPQVISEFGYGLSLYLCKHELEAMGARIWYESEEGVGTLFSLLLPASHESSSAS
jgi:hypothetical protein